jgi:hypothetical protein
MNKKYDFFLGVNSSISIRIEFSGDLSIFSQYWRERDRCEQLKEKVLFCEEFLSIQYQASHFLFLE